MSNTIISIVSWPMLINVDELSECTTLNSGSTIHDLPSLPNAGRITNKGSTGKQQEEVFGIKIMKNRNGMDKSLNTKKWYYRMIWQNIERIFLNSILRMCGI